MSGPEQTEARAVAQVAVGQVWKRLRDGRAYRVIDYERRFEDVRLQSLTGTRTRHQIFAYNLVRTYMLVEGDAS